MYSGKGTQATFLKNTYNLVHISTGDVFRFNIKNETKLGVLAKSFMDKGELVPDQVTIDMLSAEVAKNLHSNGFIFDGFPRNTLQARYSKCISKSTHNFLTWLKDDYKKKLRAYLRSNFDEVLEEITKP